MTKFEAVTSLVLAIAAQALAIGGGRHHLLMRVAALRDGPTAPERRGAYALPGANVSATPFMQ